MGQEHGVGYDGVDGRTKRQQAADFFGSARQRHPNASRLSSCRLFGRVPSLSVPRN